MKKILVVAGLACGVALGVHAQGIVWNNQDSGAGVVWHVYSPDPVNSTVETQGNISTGYTTSVRNGDLPTGTTTYNGTLLGGTATGTGSTAWQNGGNYSIALYGAVGANVAAGSLSLVPGSTTTFNTSNTRLAGFFNPIATDPQVPGATYGGTVTVQARAWYSGAGQFATYEDAVAGNAPTGVSAPVNDVMAANPTVLDGPAPLQSFDLTTTTPEPSTIALGIMGASAFLIRRRKNS